MNRVHIYVPIKPMSNGRKRIKRWADRLSCDDMAFLFFVEARHAFY